MNKKQNNYNNEEDKYVSCIICGELYSKSKSEEP
jgi:hypothetical protein